ncbi:MAG: hypothetical protein ACLGSH_16360 [Acidobacteriota bacterium]
MSKIAEAAVATEIPDAHLPESPGARLVEEALTELLKSTPFRSSKQSQQLLCYIVKQTLANNGELLKERIIGIEVFGRRTDYDTSADPIVRSRATEVRRRLAQYYMGEGIHAPIRIEINPGSYHASFSTLRKPEGHSPLNGSTEAALLGISVVSEAPSAIPEGSVPFCEPIKKPRFRIHRSTALWGTAALLLVTLALSWWFDVSPIDQFWGPLFKGSKPLLIYTGSVQVRDATFVISGDLFATVKVADLMSRRRQIFDTRTGQEATFEDFRQVPAVLIGCLNNQWALLLNDGLQFDCKVVNSVPMIEERIGGHRQWTTVYSKDGKVETDYAVVSRLALSNTGQPLIVIAGIADSGTRAAAEFITNPERVKQLALIAPKGWESKNLQFVLQTKVVNGIPSTSTIVADRIW